MLQRINAGKDIDNNRQTSSQPHQHQHHHLHHFRPLSFRCKTAEMLNLVTVEDGPRSRTKSVGANHDHINGNRKIKKNASFSFNNEHLAESESLTSSSFETTSDEEDDEQGKENEIDKNHYEDVLNSLGESFLKNFESDDWSMSDITGDAEDMKQSEDDEEEEICEDYLEHQVINFRDKKEKMLQTVNFLIKFFVFLIFFSQCR